PDRGLKELVRLIQDSGWKTKSGNKEVPGIAPEHYPEATKEMISKCAVCDTGGYLFPLGESTQNLKGALKRDSCFEVGWLISEHRGVVDFTQHAAYHETQEHNLFVQNIRSGIYAGVLRIDLDRIGYNDWWWLHSNSNPQKYSINNGDRAQRAKALLEAIEQYLLSLGGAKQAGWLQHPSGLLEGVTVTSGSGPAPFVSPIKLSFSNGTSAIERNSGYIQKLKDLKGKKSGIELYEFLTMAEFADKMGTLRDSLQLS
ncbi:MAG: DevR family CRISPR-associated autoregulator, partial [Desulfobacterales bacterium]|nr:DevR family CRISPR-associated autoregulator [Desulfobacterales bacterium]